MTNQTDAELIAMYRTGDAAAFETLIRRYLGPIYRFLLGMVKDRQTAEDLTQDTFVKIWRTIDRVDARKDFRSWAYIIAKNTAIDHLRKRPSIPFSDLDQEDAPDAFADTVQDLRPLQDAQYLQKQTVEELRALLMRLSPEARASVLLHDLEDMTFQEISERSREPLNTVKSRYRRAILSLQRMVKQGAPTGDDAPKTPHIP